MIKPPKTGYNIIKQKKGEKKMKYVCVVCGYEYDEEVEGVKFEELPEDYECPLCGVGKDQFEVQE